MKLLKESNKQLNAKRYVSVGDEIFFHPDPKTTSFDGWRDYIPVYSHQLVVVKVANKTFEAEDRIGNLYRVSIKHDRFQVLKRA